VFFSQLRLQHKVQEVRHWTYAIYEIFHTRTRLNPANPREGSVQYPCSKLNSPGRRGQLNVVFQDASSCSLQPPYPLTFQHSAFNHQLSYRSVISKCTGQYSLYIPRSRLIGLNQLPNTPEGGHILLLSKPAQMPIGS
jgi:hypothetical protein